MALRVVVNSICANATLVKFLELMCPYVLFLRFIIHL